MDLTAWFKRNWWWIVLLLVGAAGGYFSFSKKSDQDSQLAKARKAKEDKRLADLAATETETETEQKEIISDVGQG